MYNSEPDTSVATLLIAAAAIFAIFQIVLMFKLWRMCNNVCDIKKAIGTQKHQVFNDDYYSNLLVDKLAEDLVKLIRNNLGASYDISLENNRDEINRKIDETKQKLQSLGKLDKLPNSLSSYEGFRERFLIYYKI